MEPVRIVTRTSENRTEPEPRTQNRFATEAIDKRESVGMELLRMISAPIALIPLDLS